MSWFLLAALGCGDEVDASGAHAESTGDVAPMASSPAPQPSATPPGSAGPAGFASELPRTIPEADLYPSSLAEQREAMFRRMKAMHALGDDRMAALRAIFDKSPVLGQGNPDVVKYAMTRAECVDRRARAGVVDPDEPVCGAPLMAPLYNPKSGQTKADAEVCIDRYEFPGLPCDYPVTWASAREAAEICEAIGKRLCDAHEWEGACAGALLDADAEYAWKLPRKEAKARHNADREIVWAYGPQKDHAKCGTASVKSDDCTASGGWKRCGSNTYPAGAFPECKSPFGVYDQHGNAAEHMNLPLRPEELASRGGKGETEMKGSWFIFQKYEAHDDDCRWRAPDWHGSKVMSPKSHQNYHLGFRCCRNVPAPTAP
jgi:hypothetical protein